MRLPFLVFMVLFTASLAVVLISARLGAGLLHDEKTQAVACVESPHHSR